VKFEFSCREILDAIGVEIQEVQKERENQNRRIREIEGDKYGNIIVCARRTTLISRLKALEQRLRDLIDTKNLLQTQPSDKKYNLTLGECGEYGLVGGEQPVKEKWRGWLECINELNRKVNSINPIPDVNEIEEHLPQLLPSGYTCNENSLIGVDGAGEPGGTHWIMNAWYEVFSPKKERVVIWCSMAGDDDDVKVAAFDIEDGLGKGDDDK
jgi:hypothetical protein